MATYSTAHNFNNSYGKVENHSRPYIFWTNYNNIWNYNNSRVRTENRFRWSTLGDPNQLSGMEGSFATSGAFNEHHNVFYGDFLVEYEDNAGNVGTQTFKLDAAGSKWHTKTFTSVAGKFEVRYYFTPNWYESGPGGQPNWGPDKLSLSFKTVSGVANHRLRRIGVRIDYVFRTDQATWTANSYARNYERKP